MSTSCHVLSASSPVLAQISQETELKEVQKWRERRGWTPLNDSGGDLWQVGVAMSATVIPYNMSNPRNAELPKG